MSISEVKLKDGDVVEYTVYPMLPKPTRGIVIDGGRGIRVTCSAAAAVKYMNDCGVSLEVSIDDVYSVEKI